MDQQDHRTLFGAAHRLRRIDRLPVAELRIDAGRDHMRAGDDDGIGVAVAAEVDLRRLLRVLHRRAGLGVGTLGDRG